VRNYIDCFWLLCVCLISSGVSNAQPYLSPPKVEPHFLHQGKDWVDSVMSTLNTRQTIGQLFMVSAFSNKDETHARDLILLIEKYGIGGVIFFQGGPVRQALIINRLQEK